MITKTSQQEDSITQSLKRWYKQTTMMFISDEYISPKSQSEIKLKGWFGRLLVLVEVWFLRVSAARPLDHYVWSVASRPHALFNRLSMHQLRKKPSHKRITCEHRKRRLNHRYWFTWEWDQMYDDDLAITIWQSKQFGKIQIWIRIHGV